MERTIVDDVVCPKCGSPLVSIDPDASDDPTVRAKLRHNARTTWWLTGFAAFSSLAVAADFLRKARDGAPALDWLFDAPQAVELVIGSIGFAATAFLAWRQLKASRIGRMAACHACDHRWRLSEFDGDGD